MTLIYKTLLICILFISSNATAAPLAVVKEKGSLRVAVYKDFWPYSYEKDGQLQGLDVDIARELASRLNVKLNLMPVTASDEAMEDDLRNAVWKGHYLGGGTADVMLHVPLDEQFAKANDKVSLFAPYLREEIAIAHSNSRIPDLNSLLLFADQHKIGVELATVADTFLMRAESGRLIDNLVHYRYIEEVCQALKNEEIAAFMAPRAQLEACIEQDPRFAISAVPARVGLFSWIVGLAVREEHTELRDALHEVMRQLHADGSLKAIFADNKLSFTPAAIQ